MQLETNARNAMIAALGTLHNSGQFRLETSGGVAVATLGFAASAFGAPATGVITAAAFTPDTAAVGGVVSRARTFTSGGAAPIATLTAGLSGAEVIMASMTIPAGATVTITSMTMTQPAS